jgi:hypothetical protein
MTKAKKKSSGWRPSGKRRPWEETRKRLLIAQDAHFAADSDRQGLWRSCPAALCKRRRRCAVDPYRCTKERGAQAVARAAAAKENKEKAAPRFAISAKDAAAIIKADVAAHIAATGNDPDGLLRG